MDIVERLRQRIGLVKFDSDAIALHDAANTIEQLRGQVDFERECREDTYADLEKQDAEIERLQGILRLITELSPFKLWPGHACLKFFAEMSIEQEISFCSARLIEITTLAHKALKEKE